MVNCPLVLWLKPSCHMPDAAWPNSYVPLQPAEHGAFDGSFAQDALRS